MTFIQTQPPGGGIPIHVRSNAKLERLQGEAEGLRKTVSQLDSRITQLEWERQMGDQNPLMDSIKQAEWEVRRRELKIQFDQAEVGLQTAKSQLKTAEREYAGWLENFVAWEHRIKQLTRELATAVDGEAPAFVITSNGGAPPRSKTEVENELLAVTRKRAVFSDDAGLMSEYEELEKRIADSRPYIFLRNTYVRLGSGELVTKEEFQRRAVEFGSDIVSRGATNSGYGPGRPIPREEAQRLGLV